MIRKLIALLRRWLCRCSEVSDARGKPCPHCQGPMIDLRSLMLRQCVDCKRSYAWELAEGQKPLIGSSRQDRKTDK